MNTAFNNLVIYNGYPLSVVVAVAFHSFILAFLIWVQSSSNIDSLELVQPTIIKALFIDENPQVRNERILERQRLERVEQQRIAREEEQQRQQEEADRQAALERQQAEAEAERERQALLEREELERQRQLELERRLEREQRELEEQRQRDLAEAERRRQIEEAERQRQQAAAEAAAAEAARTEFELVQSATAIIQMAVQQVWNRPPSARNGMRVILQIRMLPTGELLDARITESSGDPAFDRSAENAAYSAAPFTELQSLPINVFNANFRTLSLIFQPEDLLN
ncbi:MAG: cell envelope integrity protein TolA [Gammaproteobacteria bacterium]|nr:cell envelope integrity protein TolA [Gammaproteobacteria bacterium]MDD9959615.1 cell envelope integrity protein TolA [Gammaproteobacteria bacterium]